MKLIDFGISYNLPSVEATSLSMKNSAGTVNYMAPEQLKMKRFRPGSSKEYRVGKKADVWALGCILHYMAYCETPYHSIPDQGKKMKSISNMNESVPVKVSNHGALRKIMDSVKRYWDYLNLGCVLVLIPTFPSLFTF